MKEMLAEAAAPSSMISDFTSLHWQVRLKLNIICQLQEFIYELHPDIGIPIGSSLGSLISEVFMTHLKDKIFLSGHPLLPYVFECRRYVDDVFWVWTGPEERVSDFLNLLNSFFTSITFTTEIGGPQINFLNLTISLLPDGYKFNIYRKKTATPPTPSFTDPPRISSVQFLHPPSCHPSPTPKKRFRSLSIW